jgi:hypothetical protein
MWTEFCALDVAGHRMSSGTCLLQGVTQLDSRGGGSLPSLLETLFPEPLMPQTRSWPFSGSPSAPQPTLDRRDASRVSPLGQLFPLQSLIHSLHWNSRFHGNPLIRGSANLLCKEP